MIESEACASATPSAIACSLASTAHRRRPEERGSIGAGRADPNLGFGNAELRYVDLVDQRLGTFGRPLLGIVQGGIDIVLPILPRQFVEQLDAVAVRIVDVDAVGHAVIDLPAELHSSALHEGQLLEPRFAVR